MEDGYKYDKYSLKNNKVQEIFIEIFFHIKENIFYIYEGEANKIENDEIFSCFNSDKKCVKE